jgi:MORN repeat
MNGMAHGKGVETFPDGTVRHDGMWIEDEPQLPDNR